MHSDNKRLQPLVTQQQKTSRFVRPTTPSEINLITIAEGILWADHAVTFWVAIVRKLKLLKNCCEIATFNKTTRYDCFEILFLAGSNDAILKHCDALLNILIIFLLCRPEHYFNTENILHRRWCMAGK